MTTTFEQVKDIADRETNRELVRETILDAFRLGDIDANSAFEWASEVGIELTLS